MFLDDIKIGKKLLGGFLIVLLILVAIAGLGYINLQDATTRQNALYGKMQGTENLALTNAAMEKMRGDIYRYIAVPADRQATSASLAAQVGIINDNMEEFRTRPLSADDKATLVQFDKAWTTMQATYKKLEMDTDAGDTKAVDAGLAAGSPAVTARTECLSAVRTLVTSSFTDAENLNIATDEAAAAASMMMIIATIVAIVIGMGIALFLTRSITGPVNQAVTMIQEMGKGHLGMRLSMTRKDEIGVMADAMDQFSEDLQNNVIGTMQQIAAGDLSAKMLAKDEKDEIAPALAGTISSLTQMIDEATSLANAAVAGKMETRGDLTKYKGGYREIILGFNNTLDAVIRPVKEAQRLSDSYANNDFADRFNESLDVQGDFVTFKKSLNNIGFQVSATLAIISQQMTNLASMAEEANASIIEIAGGSQKLAESSSSVSQNSEQGEHSMHEVLKAMEDFSRTVTQVSTRSEDVSHLVSQADELAGAGKELAREAETGMKGINSASIELDTMISDIREQMGEIGKVVSIISEISDETNLLALNAAIEAARAGEAGMGFAVVADEVKELAGESRKSAENIAQVIANLQKRSENASQVMKNASTQVEKGTEAVEKTLEAFNQIVNAISDITQNIGEVASASEEQAAAIQEITTSANEVSNLITRTSHEATDSAAISEETSASVDQIREVFADVNQAVEDLSREMQKFTISGA